MHTGEYRQQYSVGADEGRDEQESGPLWVQHSLHTWKWYSHSYILALQSHAHPCSWTDHISCASIYGESSLGYIVSQLVLANQPAQIDSVDNFPASTQAGAHNMHSCFLWTLTCDNTHTHTLSHTHCHTHTHHPCLTPAYSYRFSREAKCGPKVKADRPGDSQHDQQDGCGLWTHSSHHLREIQDGDRIQVSAHTMSLCSPFHGVPVPGYINSSWPTTFPFYYVPVPGYI